MADEEALFLSDEQLSRAFVGDAYSLYMKEVLRYSALSSEENRILARQYKNGDFSAREKMINGNLRLVIFVATQYKDSITHLQILDVIQEGNLGLMKAIDAYDPEISAFSTYALWWIRQAITRSIANKEEEIRKPVHFQEKVRQYHRIMDACRMKKTTLDDTELCRVLEVGMETLDNIKNASKFNAVSMNQKVDDDESAELGDFLSSEIDSYQEVEDKMVNYQLFVILKTVLSPLEYFVVYRRILDNPQSTLEEVASFFSVTRERIRQVEAKTLRKIKPYLEENSFKSRNVLQSVVKREGKLWEYLNIEPIYPLSIVRYFYIRDLLTEDEKKLFHHLYLGKYSLRDQESASLLGYSMEEYNQIKVSLASKMQHKFADVKTFKKFKDSMLKNYGTRIYSLDLNSDIHFVDYESLKNRYFSASLEDIQILVSRYADSFSTDEMALLEKFYRKSEAKQLSAYELLKDINLTILGYKKQSTTVPKEKLYKVYKANLEDYTEEQRLFLECYFFQVRDKNAFLSLHSDNALFYRFYYSIERLERTYYNIHCYFENNFTKEEYLKFKSKYKDRFSAKRLELLDLFYGVFGRPYTISEMASMYGVPYIKMHDMISDAREAAISLYSGRGGKLEIDKRIYRPFVNNPAYEFTSETRAILHMFLIENKDYGEIEQETGLTKYRISNIVTDGIRRIDSYRFGITPVRFMTFEELDAFFQSYSAYLKPEEKEVLRLKCLEHMGNAEIVKKLNIELKTVNAYVRHFNKLYYSYRIQNVSVSKEEIEAEVFKHPSESILDEKEKELASYFYGFSYSSNLEGLVKTSEEICSIMHLSKYQFYHIQQSILEKVKGYKIGIKRADHVYMSRKELNRVLEDSHLPISSKEREIICYLFALNGYPYKTFTDLTTIYQDSKGSLIRRYNRSMLSIFKYLQKEIPGQLHYEEDIVPNLKYFSLADRKLITKYFAEGMSIEQLAEEYQITFYKMLTLIDNIHTRLFDLLHNPKTKKFDFDYYLQVRYNPDLPFFGDLEKSIAVFDLYYGMVGDLRLSVPEIIKQLHLDLAATSVGHAANRLMLAVCKYRDGIRKSYQFSYEDVRAYYDAHKDTMSPAHKREYAFYFRKFSYQNRINGISFAMNYRILYDQLLNTHSDVVTLDMLNRESVLQLLKKYRHELQPSVRNELMALYSITERDFMNGKDMNHIYRILDKLYQLEYKNDYDGIVLKKTSIKNLFYVKIYEEVEK